MRRWIVVSGAALMLAAASCQTARTTPVGAPAEVTYKPGPAKAIEVADIARKAVDVPKPITRRAPATVRFTFETKEVIATLDDGVTYQYWTFNGTVPGPLVRAREGDTVEITLRNPQGNVHLHSVDLHAVKGPGGGMEATNSAPGATNTFRFKALRAGLYVYHCASEHVPSHMGNGMYGLILIEPAGGLPRVDRELYVMQGDFYTKGPKGQKGHQEFDIDALRRAEPTYVVFNGRVGALLDAGSPKVRTGQRVRIFFGNGGPNFVSSFHIIGEIFDQVWPEGDLVSAPHRNVQTTVVPAGGAVMVEINPVVPGRYLLVDHSISRTVDLGSLGAFLVEGPERRDLFAKL